MRYGIPRNEAIAHESGMQSNCKGRNVYMCPSLDPSLMNQTTTF